MLQEKKKIAVVVQDGNIRDLTLEFAQTDSTNSRPRLDIEVKGFASYGELAQAKAQQWTPDLYILRHSADQGMRACEYTGELRQQPDNSPVIVVSGLYDPKTKKVHGCDCSAGKPDILFPLPPENPIITLDAAINHLLFPLTSFGVDNGLGPVAQDCIHKALAKGKNGLRHTTPEHVTRCTYRSDDVDRFCPYQVGSAIDNVQESAPGADPRPVPTQFFRCGWELVQPYVVRGRVDVMVVDDERVVAEPTALFLESAGKTIKMFETSMALWQAYHDQQNPITARVYLLDHFPAAPEAMTGCQIIETLRRRGEPSVFILMSGLLSDLEEKCGCTEQGHPGRAHYYVEKPAMAKQLSSAIANIAAGGSPAITEQYGLPVINLS